MSWAIAYGGFREEHWFISDVTGKARAGFMLSRDHDNDRTRVHEVVPVRGGSMLVFRADTEHDVRFDHDPELPGVRINLGFGREIAIPERDWSP